MGQPCHEGIAAAGHVDDRAAEHGQMALARPVAVEDPLIPEAQEEPLHPGAVEPGRRHGPGVGPADGEAAQLLRLGAVGFEGVDAVQPGADLLHLGHRDGVHEDDVLPWRSNSQSRVWVARLVSSTQSRAAPRKPLRG